MSLLVYQAQAVAPLHELVHCDSVYTAKKLVVYGRKGGAGVGANSKPHSPRASGANMDVLCALTVCACVSACECVRV